MKKSLYIIIAAVVLLVSYSEVQAQGKDSPEYLRQLNIYRKAKYFNDPMSARQALYNMIEIDPGNTSLIDSLAYEFYSYRQYTSALLASIESLKMNGNNLEMLEMKAICWENVGDETKALDSYEQLFLKTNSSVTLYRIGFLQLSLKRFAEANTSADILVGKEDANEIKIMFPKGEGQQQVPLKAAAYNLKGLIAKEQGNKEEAKKQFNEALKISPDFEIVKNNLSELDG